MKLIATSFLAFMLIGCTPKSAPLPPSTSSQKSSSNAAETLVIIGDSLTEGYGVPREKAYPFLVEEMFASLDRSIKFVNSGISGSTSASAPERVKWALQTNPDYVVLALGANDGLRGLPSRDMKKHLSESIDLAQQAGVRVFLFGMLVPPNFGARYSKAYENVFKDLAKEKRIPLLPFLLQDVAGIKQLNQADGIHPNEEGHKIMANHIFKFLREHIQ